MKCIAPEEFVEMLEAGRLDHPSPDVARHLGECAECRDAWSSIGAADEVLPSLRPVRRRNPFRAFPAIAAALLLVMLGSVLWFGKGGRETNPGSTLSQDAEKEMSAAIERLKSDDPEVRERAENAIVELARKIGKGSLRWLRDQEKKADHPEVKSRLATVLRRLGEPQVLWTAILQGASFGAIAPAVDPRVCVFSSEDFLWGVEPRTGKVLWKTDGDYRAHALVTPDAVFAPGPKGPGVDIRALRPLTGQVLWSHGIADLWTPPPEEPSLYYQDSQIVRSGPWIYTGTRTGSLLCLDVATGKRRWATPPRAGSGVFNPTVHDGKVFAAEWNRGLLAFDVETGKLLWETKAPGIGTTSPIVVGERVIVVTHELDPSGNRGDCLAYSTADGSPLWKTSLAAQGLGGVGLIDAGSVVLVQGKTAVAGLSAETGALKWTVQANRFGYSTLARDDRGRIYFGTDAGQLLVVESASGKVLLAFDANTLPEAAEAPKVRLGDQAGTTSLGAAGSPAVLGRDVYLLWGSGFAVALRMPEFLGDSD